MSMAKTNFDKNNTSNQLAMQYLGMALHYFADLNAPHHVGNLVAGLSRHTQWENYADANRTNYRIYNGSLYNYYGTSFYDYGQDAAYNGYRNINYAESTETYFMNIAAENTYEYAQNSLAAIIDAFFRSEGVY
ncbi:MAG: hypothetical protein VR72_21590 [Clostridiaceae bacterium BRH_c20a]|nr:MAG: hypothetical protein VR72_21590 [Clostridiaceae bacterium BRH_c20a]